jgi:hypothetical protein
MGYMKVTLDIDESKLPFFMELVKSLKFIKTDIDSDFELSETQQKIIGDRLDAIEADPSRLSKMDDFLKEMDELLG